MGLVIGQKYLECYGDEYARSVAASAHSRAQMAQGEWVMTAREANMKAY